MAPTEPWETLIGYVSPVVVGNVTWLYYQSYITAGQGAVNGSGCYVCVAHSTDHGSTWTKPKLDRYTWRPTGKSQIVASLPLFQNGAQKSGFEMCFSPFYELCGRTHEAVRNTLQ